MSNKYGSRWLPRWTRLAIYIRDSFVCCYCQRDLRNEPARNVTLDHVIARSAGGDDSHTNLITACISCNSSRKDKPIAEYAKSRCKTIYEQLAQPINRSLAMAMINGNNAENIAK